jgi:hypothetical protein
MNRNDIVSKLLFSIRNNQYLSTFKSSLPRLSESIRGNNESFDKRTLQALFNDHTDLLHILLSLLSYHDDKVFVSNNDTVTLFRNSLLKLSLSNISDVRIIFDLLRTEINYQAKQHDICAPYEYKHDVSNLVKLPLAYHAVVLDKLVDIAVKCDPPCVVFPGDKKGYIQLTTVQLSCTSSYTFTAWIKSSLAKQDTKGFVLFRCRSASGGIDVIMSDKSQDGQWQVIVRSFREMTPGTSTIFKEEVQGYVYIPPSKWHLIAVKHTKFYMKPAVISFLVDGILEWESDLSYPFSTPTDSQWIIGLGFQGQIASFAVYSDAIDTQLLKLQYDQGFYCKTLHDGIRYPQTSFDSGFSTLGSLAVKGPLALKLVKTSLIFAIDPSYFIASGDFGKDAPYNLASFDIDDYNKGLPMLKTSFLNFDKIEMIPASESASQPIIPLLSGDCRLNLDESIIDYFLAHDGATSILYLLWGYCSLLQAPLRPSSSSDPSYALAIDPYSAMILTNVKSVFKLLRVVLLSSGEIREHFLQNHG